MIGDTEYNEIVVISADRYSRLQLAGWQPQVLRAARALVVGAGALGNEVIKNLALLGIGSVLIVDFDTIDLSNLSRSVLFRKQDVGRKKAEVAALRAKEINPTMEVAWLHGDVEQTLGTGVFRRMDLVFGCLDNRAARLAINRRCWLANKPWIDGALDGLNGVARVFVPGKGACYECTLTEAAYIDLGARYSCQGVRWRHAGQELIPTTPTSASLVAALQVEKGMQLLHKLEVPAGYELVYSSALNELAPVRLPEKEDCMSHEIAEPLVECANMRATETTLRQLLNKAQASLAPGATLELDWEVVISLTCPTCGITEEQVIPALRLTEDLAACPRCGQERALASTHRIDHKTLFLDSRLCDVGIPPGHIVRARHQGVYCYLELSGDFPAALIPNVVA